MNEEQKRYIDDRIRVLLREELSNFFRSDRYTLDRLLQLSDGKNIQVGKTTGTIIGTEATQKLGFFGKTPIVQRPSHTGSVNTNEFGTSRFAASTYGITEQTMLNAIYQALFGYGLIREEA